MFAVPFPFEPSVPPRRLLNASPPIDDCDWTGFCCTAGLVLGVMGREFGVDAEESIENTSFCGRRVPALFNCGDAAPSF
jgi:hypothetical protein